MERYRNLSGISSVLAYKNEPDAISVQFTDGSIYLYTVQSAGKESIQAMQELALQGRGLAGFIDRTVRTKYARKIR